MADYVTVNVSSPNTPGLRKLQQRAALDELLGVLVAQRPLSRNGSPLPLLVKIAPDLGEGELDAILDVALARGIEGLVVCNTTIARDGLRSLLAREAGGLSGAPLRDSAEALLQACHRRVGSRLTLIGVGGIANAEDAWRRIRAGASLIQLYTGFIYQGPSLPGTILHGLSQRLASEGAGSIGEVVGADS
jgi:dihydroorotate dehydrogenase